MRSTVPGVGSDLNNDGIIVLVAFFAHPAVFAALIVVPLLAFVVVVLSITPGVVSPSIQSHGFKVGAAVAVVSGVVTVSDESHAAVIREFLAGFLPTLGPVARVGFHLNDNCVVGFMSFFGTALASVVSALLSAFAAVCVFHDGPDLEAAGFFNPLCGLFTLLHNVSAVIVRSPVRRRGRRRGRRRRRAPVVLVWERRWF